MHWLKQAFILAYKESKCARASEQASEKDGKLKTEVCKVWY